MKTVYIHIGPGKTGTSFLQSVFSYNAERYILRGLSYPDLNNNRSTAANGVTTSGNALPIAAYAVPALAGNKTVISPAELLNLLNADVDHLLSSEWLSGCSFAYLQDLKGVLSQRFNVWFLAVVRDPSEHIASFYQEGLKNGLYSSSVDRYMDLLIENIRNLYNLVFQLKDSVTLVNYDHCKNNIVDCFDKILFGESFSKNPSFSVVNRSPDAHQTTVLQIANSLYLSNIRAARHYIMQNSGENRPVYVFPNYITDKIFGSLEWEINEINKILPEDQSIKQRLRQETSELRDILYEPDINFLTSLIREKIESEKKCDRDFIQKWANEPAYKKPRGLPKGFSIVAYFFYNPDLVAARVDPVEHYLSFGAKEGRRYK